MVLHKSRSGKGDKYDWEAVEGSLRTMHEDPMGQVKEPRWDWEGIGNSQRGEVKYLRERKDADGKPAPIAFVEYDIAEWSRFVDNSKRGVAHDADHQSLSAWLAQVPTHPQVVGHDHYFESAGEGWGEGRVMDMAQVVATIAARHGDVFAVLAGTAGLSGEDVDVAELGRRLGGRGEMMDEFRGVWKALKDIDYQMMYLLMLRLHWELRFPLNAKFARRYIKVAAHPPGLSPLSRAELQAVGGVPIPLARMAAVLNMSPEEAKAEAELLLRRQERRHAELLQKIMNGTASAQDNDEIEKLSAVLFPDEEAAAHLGPEEAQPAAAQPEAEEPVAGVQK